jgi:hypothetical protein
MTDDAAAADAPAESPDAGATADAGEETVPVFGPIAKRPASSVLPATLSACDVYRATSCVDGSRRTCEIYDSVGGGFAEKPDPYLEQIYWYDRYYDLYHRMEGQQSEFYYTRPMAPGTPESEWGAPENFSKYWGHWDSAGWTGTALQASAARYLATGTGADYTRMLNQFEAMMFMYEATGAPGLLMRCHYAMLEEGAPDPVGNPGKALVAHTPPENWEDHFPLSPGSLAKLPAYYTQGVDIQGKHYATKPAWMGHASRDMYVRSLPGIMLAFDLLGTGDREEALRSAVQRQLPCTLKRLKKLRIRNVQSNEDIKKAIAAYLGSDSLRLDPGDIDLTALNTLYGYVLEEPHPERMEKFDPSCPDSVPMEVDPQYNLDARSGDFITRFANIMSRLGGQGDVPIAWILFPSARGSDVLFMTQWALAGHYLTGDTQFLRFLMRMMDEVDYWPVINTMGSFWRPKWCRSHYGPSLLYPTFWNTQNRVDRGRFPRFWTSLGRAIKEEFREKELAEANDAYFGVLYDSMVDAAIDPGVAAYAKEMVALLRDEKQMQALDPSEPHRNYSIDHIANPPGAPIEIEPLTAAEREICLRSIEVFGMKIEGYIDDELPRAVEGLPLPLRFSGPFQWQEDPFMLVKDYGADAGRVQWPMQGHSVAFWTGRMQGTITAGAGSALAWRDTGEPCP